MADSDAFSKGINSERKATYNDLIAVEKFLGVFPGQEMKGYDDLEMLGCFPPSCDVRRE
jgi:hypothetical protein